MIYHASFIDESNINFPPDQVEGIVNKVAPRFVISRTPKGHPLSYYSDDVWDFTPYSTSRCIFSFNNFLGNDKLAEKIIDEVKDILWRLIFDKRVKRNTYKKIASYRHEFNALKAVARIAYKIGITLSQAETSAAFQVSIRTSIANYMQGDIENNELKSRGIDNLFESCRHLHNLSKQHGISTIKFISEKDHDTIVGMLRKMEREENRTPLIPTRIFSNIISSCEELINSVSPHLESIKNLLKKYSENPYYYCNSMSSYVARCKRKGINHTGYKSKNKITSDQVVTDLGLSNLFKKYVKNPNDIRSLYRLISNTQMACWIYILAHTGMRRHEACVMPYTCFQEIEIYGYGKVPVIISYTSKIGEDNYSGKLPWATSNAIKKVVEASQHIAECQCIKNGMLSYQLDTMPLWVGSSWWISKAGFHYSIPLRDFDLNNDPFGYDILRESNITQSDLDELELFDAFRNWSEEKKFKIGNLWPLTAHQFRRSVAVYASRSGMVSLPSLGTQFKHLSQSMTALYAENSSFAKNFINTEQNEIPRTHQVVKDFLDSVAFNQSINFFEQVIQAETRLSGGEGTRIQRLKDTDRLPHYLEDPKETEKAIKQGRMRYTETVVGGCMRKEVCDSYGIDDVVPCIFHCPDSVIGGDGGKKLKAYAEGLILGLDEMDDCSLAYRATQKEIELIKVKLLNDEGIEI